MNIGICKRNSLVYVLTGFLPVVLMVTDSMGEMSFLIIFVKNSVSISDIKYLAVLSAIRGEIKCLRRKIKMTIWREIDGKRISIDLTSEELREVYWEQKRVYDAEDICSRYTVPDNKVDEAVDRFESAIGNNDSFWESYWMTVDYVCNEMGFEEREDE